MKLTSTVSAVLAATALTAVVDVPARAAKPAPVNATVKVDPTRTATATITAASGGSLAVKAANGTAVQVSFPAGAVAADTVVTATVVKRLGSKITRKGFDAGVQLGPEGLILLKPATVRFTRRGKAPKNTKSTFVGSAGDGRDLYRLPPQVRIKGKGRKRIFVSTGRPVVLIGHFSTVNLFDWSEATQEDIDSILRPELGVNRMSQALAKLIREGASYAEIEQAMQHEYNRFVVPLVEQAAGALNNCTAVASVRGAKKALEIAATFVRQAELLAISTSGFTSVTAELLAKAGECIVKLCPEAGDPTAAAYFVSLAHQLEVIGGGAGHEEFFATLLDNMRRCGAFEVRIDARIDSSDPEVGTYSYRVTGVAKVEAGTIDAGKPTGPLEYAQTSGGGSFPCLNVSITSTIAGKFELTDITLADFDPDRPTANPVKALTLTVKAQPMETYHSTPGCPGTPPPDFPAPRWQLAFEAEHPGWTFPGRDFLRDAAPVFAVAVYSGRPIVVDQESISENTKIEIVHTPLPPVPLPGLSG